MSSIWRTHTHNSFFLSLFQILFQKMLLGQYGQRYASWSHLQLTPFSWHAKTIKELILWICSVKQNNSLLICVDNFKSFLYDWFGFLQCFVLFCGSLANLSWRGRSPVCPWVGTSFYYLDINFLWRWTSNKWTIILNKSSNKFSSTIKCAG